MRQLREIAAAIGWASRLRRPYVVMTLLGLTLQSQSVYARWEKVFDSWDVLVNTGNIEQYNEAETNERITKVWVLRDFATPFKLDRDEAHSAIFLYAIICDKRKYTMGVTAYSGKGGDGAEVLSESAANSRWAKDIPPGTLPAALADRYCRKSWQFWR